MAGILQSRGKRTAIAVFFELAVSGAWAMIDAKFVADNAQWFLLVGLVGLFLIWFADRIWKFIQWEKAQLIESHQAKPPVVALTDKAEAEIVKPLKLTDNECADCKDGIGRLRTLVDRDVSGIQRDARWLGGAPQKLTPRVDELELLRDRADSVRAKFLEALDAESSHSEMLGLDLSYVAEALLSLRQALQGMWANMGVLRNNADQSAHQLINQIKTPAMSANAELEGAINRARGELNAARKRLG